MSRYTPRKSSEFEARQLCFEFGEACRFVAKLAAEVKKTLKSWAAKMFAPVINEASPPVQQNLDLNFEDFPQWQKT